jgi:hypothetical protein
MECPNWNRQFFGCNKVTRQGLGCCGFGSAQPGLTFRARLFGRTSYSAAWKADAATV